MKNKKWEGLTQVQLQDAIVQQNHHISKTTAAAEALAEALRGYVGIEETGAPYSNSPTRIFARTALAQWEEAQK